MKTFTILALTLVIGLVLVVQTEAQGRRGSRRQQQPVESDDLGGSDDSQPSPPRRRQHPTRKYNQDDDEEPASSASASSDDQADSQDIGTRPSRAGSRRRYSDPEEDRPVRPRRTRKNRRNNNNNNNNVNFNGLPDGFPSAAFGAGFGAAVSSGGRGRGPSNASGFGAGFAQSGGGNALAGGFGSGLVGNGANGGYGGRSRYDDDDEDNDYESGRAKPKTTANCIMLQLVQPPSERIQRLMEEECRKSKAKKSGSSGQTIEPEIDPQRANKRRDETAESFSGDAYYDTGASESQIRETDSIVGSYSNSSSDPPDNERTSISTYVDDGTLVASSASSYTSPLVGHETGREGDELDGSNDNRSSDISEDSSTTSSTNNHYNDDEYRRR